MAWGSKTAADATLTSITTEQFFLWGGSDLITLNPGETLHVQVKFNPPSSPTDHLVVSVYATLDASSPTYDTTPFITFQIDKSIDPNYASFLVTGVYGCRIGVKRSGTTDTITDATCSIRKDGVNI